MLVGFLLKELIAVLCGQLVAEEGDGGAEAAFVAEGDVVEVVDFDGQTLGDVVADHLQPLALLGGEVQIPRVLDLPAC